MSKDLMKRRFDDIIGRKDLKSNSFCMSAVKYRDVLDEIKIAKSGKKISRHYRLLRHYDRLLINGEEKLVTPVVKDSPILFDVTQEEMFDVLYDIHNSIGHVGRDRMKKEIQRRYKNITAEHVQTFLSLCDTCLQKKSSDKKGFLLKPRPPPLITSRCQVEMIDYSKQGDGIYKYIMVYQDQHTKFIILRPLQSDKVEEISQELLHIFLLFGAPNIIQSEIGRDFCRRIIEHLRRSWPQLKVIDGRVKVVTGRERKADSYGGTLRLKQGLKALLTNWMQDNLTNKWTKGLPFVQFAKNRSEHPAIRKSPYQATFGHPARMGLNTADLPRDVIQNVNTEEDLERHMGEGAASSVTQLGESAAATEEAAVDDVEAIAVVERDDVQCKVCGANARMVGSNACPLGCQQYQVNAPAPQEQRLWLGATYLKTDFHK